jgi:hypothetical protein
MARQDGGERRPGEGFGGDTPPLQPESLRRMTELDALSAFSERLQQFTQTSRGHIAIDPARGDIEN